MLLSTVNPEAAAAIGTIKKVGVGNIVVYHPRAGVMRGGRSAFPAMVLRQREDGSVDVLVFFESEDFAVEEHVQFQSHNAPHHCWSVVTHAPTSEPAPTAAGDITWANPGETLNELIARIEALEAKRGPGRPAKPKAA